MNQAATQRRPDASAERLAFARSILTIEAGALASAAERLDENWTIAVELVLGCTGRIAVTGVGKSDDIGRKWVGTLNSTGTRSYALDATRAMHGDLGMVHPDDVVLMLSHGGESEELLRLVPPLRRIAAGLIAVTGNAESTLARTADVAIAYGPLDEACPLSLAPSTSTTVMLALGDALAFTLSEARAFTAQDFARFHPAGSLGRKLAGVSEYMRHGKELRIAFAADPVRKVFAVVRHVGRRTGAVMLVDAEGRLTGLFTDSDLARLFEANRVGDFEQPIADVMTKNPITLPHHAKLGEALDLLKDRKISELPIVDDDGKPVGLLDITDVLGVDPQVAPAPLRPNFRLVPTPP